VDNRLVSWALDETGTVDTPFMCNNFSNNEQIALTELQERNRVREMGIPEEVLQVHGVAPSKKGEGIVRLFYENANGICNKLCDDKKVEKAKEIHNEFEVDIATYDEHKLNMRNRQNTNGFHQLFKGGKAAVSSMVTQHYIHDKAVISLENKQLRRYA
jgi:hypothetical protein